MKQQLEKFFQSGYNPGKACCNHDHDDSHDHTDNSKIE